MDPDTFKFTESSLNSVSSSVELDHLILVISNSFWYVMGAVTVSCFVAHLAHCKWQSFCDCRRLQNLKCKRSNGINACSRGSFAREVVPAPRAGGSSSPSSPPSLPGASLSTLARKLFASDWSEEPEEGAALSSSFASSGSECGAGPRPSVSDEQEMLQRRRKKAAEWEEARRGLVECTRKQCPEQAS